MVRVERIVSDDEGRKGRGVTGRQGTFDGDRTVEQAARVLLLEDAVMYPQTSITVRQ